jgi:tyrocidine synthetase III
MNQVTDAAAEYWLESLADVTELRLPIIAGEKTAGTSTVKLPVTAAQVELLRKIAGDKDLNVFKLFMGGLGILLWRYAAQNELLISMSPMLLPGVDADASGTWHCRLKLQPDMELRAFFTQVHEAISDAYENADYDESELLSSFSSGNGSVSALKSVGFHYNRLNAQGSWLDAHQLVFEFVESDESYLSCTSRSGLYATQMLRNMLESLLMLALEFPQNKDKKLSACNILPPGQLQSWCSRFEKNVRNYPKDATVVDLFIQHATEHPAKAAIVYGQQETSYGELNELSAKIAGYIIENAPHRKDLLVGIMMDRSPAMVAAIIGILRAGAAYVPIDKNYPDDRIRDILHDAHCPLIFTGGDEQPVTVEGCTFVSIHAIESSSRAQRLPAAGDLAYIIYSSGTTGKPKGIMMEHGPIMNLLFWYNERYNINSETRIIQLTNLVIDIAFQEIFSALMNGLTLYVPLAEESQDKQAFIDYLNRHRINFIQLIPDMLSEYLGAIPKLPHLEQVLCGGDKLSDSLKDLIVSKGYKLYNIYGQTETAIDTVGAVCHAGQPMRFNEYLPHYDVLIMDEYGNVCPEYLPGEIYTGGPGLARGYLNQPELTAQKFIPHPLRAGQRIYRTGDMARRLPDGCLELMGRKDDQVKIRGFRVELAEVENALRSHPQIDAATVLALQKAQDKQLAAYIVGDKTLSAAELRAYLSQTLPDYMLPAHFVQLDKLPLTPSGKVDRRKLPDPEGIGMETGVPYVAPRNELELGMAKIWQQLLGKERIGIRDGFFESGGDSIKILRLMSEMKKELNVKISFADIYQHNTIENIVAHLQANKEHIEQQNKRAGEKEALVREQLNALKERVLLQIAGNSNIADVYPMSDIEKGIVYESLLSEGSGIYHDLAVHERIFPGFSISRFTRALELLMEKHSILRTSFNLDDFETEVQLVHQQIAVPIQYRDIAGLNRQQQEELIREFVAAQLRQPFKFAVAPLWRMSVFNCGNDEVVFVSEAHHSIMDGWSDASFMTELNNVYLELGKDADYKPAPLKSGYKDFVVQHEIDKADNAIKDFWKQELAGYSRLDLFGEDEAARFFCPLDETFVQKLERTAQDAGTSVKVVTLSAYLLLLKMLNYDNEVVAGLVTNMRPDCEDSDQIIGCFLNTIPLRLNIPDHLTGHELLKQVHDKLVVLKGNERLSMLEISLLHDKQLQHGNPFFDVLFNYVDFHAYNAMQSGGGAQGSDNRNLAANNITNTYLDLDVNRTGGDCTLGFRLAKKLKCGMPVERLAELYRSILSGLINYPARNIHEWDFVTAGEQHKLLVEFNNTAISFDRPKNIQLLFEEQASKTPGNTAVVCAGTSISYQQLNEQANQLAHYLAKQCDIQPDDVIAIRLDKTSWLIVSILAILKAGAAYLPVDPGFDNERSAFMLADSNCKLVIDEDFIEAFKQRQQECSTQNPSAKAGEHNLAYIIHTSGSTGKPKGVMIEHQSVADYALSFAAAFNIRQQDRVIQQASISFDTHVEEIFPALISGASVLLVRNGTRDIQQLQDVITRERATVLSATPQVLNELHALHTPLSSIRLLISGGDSLNSASVAGYLGKMEIYDSYGPTEATVASTWNKIEDAHTVAIIGSPASNRGIYILNHRQNLLPIGLTGEIYIAGTGLARGYLNQPELTQQKFLPNPFDPGTRMYATGDLGRWLPDGKIAFIGRKDEQVKVSGCRIEPGEIESILYSYPGIDAVSVLAKSNGDGDAQLVAYIVSEESISPMELRAYLDQSLPPYMVPHRYVQLQELPLASNGKVDRKALLALECADMHIAVEYVAPRNETETKLALIWQQVLDREKISAKDHFFELGGHSLKITRVASQVHKTFDVKIPLKDLFNSPVLEEQAALIQRSRKTTYSQILPVQQQPHYPLSAAQRRLWVLCQFEQGSIAYNMPSVCIFEGRLDLQAVEDAFNTVIDRHESLRTVFREDEEGEVRQFINPPGSYRLTITVADIRNNPNQQQLLAETLQTAFSTPFDLVTGPLLRATICQLEDNKWMFAYVMHHIVGDGWSMNVLMNELLILYDVKLKQQPSPLPPLKIQYKDFTAWQHDQLRGPNAQHHRAYWMNQFSGELPLLALPADKIRPAVKTYNGGMVHKTIDARLTKSINALVKQHGATLFMGLLGVVNTLLHKYTNQEDIIIGTPIAGREHADLDDQIGFYINTLPLRARFKRQQAFTELLAHLKEITLGAFEHQVYPLDELVNELDLQRDMSRSALFDVMVVLQNTDSVGTSAPRDFEGLYVRPYYDADDRSSAFDLTFTFAEGEGEIKATIQYNSDIYNRDTIARMADHMEQLLRAVTAAPATPIEKLDYLSDAEKQQLLSGFAGLVQEYPKDKTLLYLFEEQVQKNPSAPAVLFEDLAISYRELNETANALGHYLRKNYSIRPNDFVGIQLDRSQWLVIAILGVLKSGGAYVPIDPAYPQERIDYIIEDSSCKVVIDNGVLGEFLEHRHEYTTGNLPVVNKSTDLAYIIYTSGSTGRPKGVMIEHRNAVAFIHWSMAEFAQSTWDVLFAATSICFDLSVYEIFYPLSIGKKLRVLNNALSIPQYLHEHEHILLNTVPGAVGALLGEQIDWRNVSVLNMAGEPIPPHFIRELDCSRIEVRNLYGPSEDTTYSTCYRMQRDAPVLVGKPISNTQVYILGNNHELVPVGVAGEICISGDGLARGYLDQPALTAEKFVDNPFTPGERMYKTGDLGRWRPDGNIEFLGRKDDQVKIRGFRIELGEIEAALRNHPHIDAAVVIAKALNGAEKELVAYITSAEQMGIAELRTYLAKQLPAYMVPGHFVQLQALPVTPNGKVDKKKLPDPQQKQTSADEACITPRNEKQRKLLALLQEVLGKKNISVHDNFFDLGGHSLKAMKLLGILNKQHGFKLKIQDIYNHPTIGELFFGGSSNSGIIRLNRYHSEAAGNIYFIPPILGNAGLYKPLADKLARRYNCYGFQYSGLEQDEPLYESIEHAAKQFSEEVINHHVKGELLVFGYSMGAAIAFEMAKLLERNGLQPTLVLVDRGIPSNMQKLLERVTAGWATKQLLNLYKHFIPTSNVDEAAVKRFLQNNVKILARYRQSGKIESRIYAFEADGNNQRMKQWNNYTHAGVTHHFIKGGHWNALDENNLHHIATSLESITQKS